MSAIDENDCWELLQTCSHDQLRALVELLDQSWDVWVKRDPRVTANADDLTQPEAVRAIYEHLRRSGGNAFVNWYHGEGISYNDLVRSVCSVMKVKVGDNETAPQMEQKLLRHVADKIWTKMGEAERLEIQEELKKVTGIQFTPNGAVPFAVLATQIGLKASGFLAYQIAVQVANIFAQRVAGIGLGLAANALISRAVAAFLGPVGFALSTIWLAIEIAGPSRKAMVPAVIHLGTIRMHLHLRDVAGDKA